MRKQEGICYRCSHYTFNYKNVKPNLCKLDYLFLHDKVVCVGFKENEVTEK